MSHHPGLHLPREAPRALTFSLSPHLQRNHSLARQIPPAKGPNLLVRDKRKWGGEPHRGVFTWNLMWNWWAAEHLTDIWQDWRLWRENAFHCHHFNLTICLDNSCSWGKIQSNSGEWKAILWHTFPSATHFPLPEAITVISFSSIYQGQFRHMWTCAI